VPGRKKRVTLEAVDWETRKAETLREQGERKEPQSKELDAEGPTKKSERMKERGAKERMKKDFSKGEEKLRKMWFTFSKTKREQSSDKKPSQWRGHHHRKQGQCGFSSQTENFSPTSRTSTDYFRSSYGALIVRDSILLVARFLPIARKWKRKTPARSGLFLLLLQEKRNNGSHLPCFFSSSSLFPSSSFR
jgi:hypothetical protein